VLFEVFLHQRHFGGAFRQLLDAIGIQRGEVAICSGVAATSNWPMPDCPTCG
jgi:hypothetical protein